MIKLITIRNGEYNHMHGKFEYIYKCQFTINLVKETKKKCTKVMFYVLCM